jgi:hypothetical protein
VSGFRRGLLSPGRAGEYKTVMNQDDDEPKGLKRLLKGVHPSEAGIVIVAFIITCCFVYLALMPQAWWAVDVALAPDQPKPPVQQQKKGETQMQLFDVQKK